eukprot:scaffold1884_cov109-Isochrysis_galbana.AAC.5
MPYAYVYRSRERHISISAGAGSFSFLPGFGQVHARCCWLVVLCMVLISAMWSRAHRTIRINAPIPPPIPYHIFSLVYTIITCHELVFVFGHSGLPSFSCSHVASHVAVAGQLHDPPATPKHHNNNNVVEDNPIVRSKGSRSRVRVQCGLTPRDYHLHFKHITHIHRRIGANNQQ